MDTLEWEKWAERAFEGVVAGFTRWILDKFGSGRKKPEMSDEKASVPKRYVNIPPVTN
jgi:hypothetical protein